MVIIMYLKNGSIESSKSQTLAGSLMGPLCDEKVNPFVRLFKSCSVMVYTTISSLTQKGLKILIDEKTV